MNIEQWKKKRGHHLNGDGTSLATHHSEVMRRGEVKLGDSGSNILPGGNHSPEEASSCCEWAIGHTVSQKSTL